MKKYIATMLIVIVLLAALLFLMRIRIKPAPILLIPGGPGLQIQPAGQLEVEPAREPIHLPQPDPPAPIRPGVQPDFDWKRHIG